MSGTGFHAPLVGAQTPHTRGQVKMVGVSVRAVREHVERLMDHNTDAFRFRLRLHRGDDVSVQAPERDSVVTHLCELRAISNDAVAKRKERAVTCGRGHVARSEPRIRRHMHSSAFVSSERSHVVARRSRGRRRRSARTTRGQKQDHYVLHGRSLHSNESCPSWISQMPGSMWYGSPSHP